MIDRTLISYKIYSLLRESIRKGEYPPGTRLKETQIAAELGVSRTPVREAIHKLERDGFVIMIPGKGAYVRGYDPEKLKELMEVRSLLEGYAAGLAAERCSEEFFDRLEGILGEFKDAVSKGDLPRYIKLATEFHEAIYRNCGNKKLLELIQSLRDQFFRLRISFLEIPEMAEESLRDHIELVRLMRKRDSRAVEDFVRRYIVKGMEVLLDVTKRGGSKDGEKN